MTRASDTAKLLGAGATILDGTTISTADNTTQLFLVSTDADSTLGPQLDLYRNSASPADGDRIGQFKFTGENDADEVVVFGQMHNIANDITDGTEDSTTVFMTMKAGTLRNRLALGHSETVFNDESLDLDFRVESDGNANMLFVDGGNNGVVAGSTSNLSSVLGAVSSAEPTFFAVQTNASDTIVIKVKNVFATGSNSATMIQFLNESNQEVGSIKSTGSATAFATSSDYRLKENVSYSFDATTRLKQLKPARFNWISDNTNTLLDGFIAHEVSSIVPEAISGTKDATTTLTKVVVGEHGNVIAENIEESDWTSGKADGTYNAETTWHSSKSEPTYQQIDQSKLVPLLVKTIQELEARIKALEDA